MWAVFWAVLFGITGAVTGFVISILKAKNTALKIEIKSLLNDSRSLVDKENRNRDDIYFHIDNNMNISFMNETACSFFKIGNLDKISGRTAGFSRSMRPDVLKNRYLS